MRAGELWGPEWEQGVGPGMQSGKAAGSRMRSRIWGLGWGEGSGKQEGCRVWDGEQNRGSWDPAAPHLHPLCAPSPSRTHMPPVGSNPPPQVTHESGGVVITDSLGVPKGCRREGGYGEVRRTVLDPGRSRMLELRVWGTHPPAQGWTAGAAPSPCPPPPLCCSRLPHRTSPACWPLPKSGQGSLGCGCGCWGCAPHPTSPSQCPGPPLAALAVPVLPAPLSPVMRMHWSLSRSLSER